MRNRCFIWLLVFINFYISGVVSAQITPKNQLNDLEKKIYELAVKCQKECVEIINNLLASHKLTEAQIFDTFYIPIPKTNPQKFSTQYDSRIEAVLQPVLDRYVEQNPALVFIKIVDKNGYVPVHNSKYSKPLTHKSELDLVSNRTKRIFNDKTGIAAARNTNSFLLQPYKRDTGEELFDLSVPILINEKHWGAVRFGYSIKK